MKVATRSAGFVVTCPPHMRTPGMTRVALLGIVCAAACSSSGDDGMADDEHYDCAMEDRDDDFVVGLEKVGANGVRFRLVESVPAPPSRGDNRWRVQVMDTGGAGVAGATLEVVPFMPDHRHGTSVVPVVTESTTTIGEYAADPVNLWMPGLWQTTVRTTTAPADFVVFAFCIPG